jgi:hypothetical protein
MMLFEANKPQTEFFKRGVEHFGTLSIEVKLAQLKGFASTHGLKVPGRLLGTHCKGSKRGYFDLTKSGFMPDATGIVTTPSLEDFTESVPKAAPVIVKPKKKRNIKTIEKPVVKFKNPIVSVSNMEGGNVFGMFHGETALTKAFERRMHVFHDNGDTTFVEFKKDIKEKGYCIIRSANCQLCCLIECFEME